MLVVEGIEELGDIHFHHPPAAHRHHPPPEDLQRLVRRTARPEAVRAVEKVLLVDRLQRHRHRPLEDLVLERGNADGPGFPAGALRDVHPPHRRRAVGARLGAIQQRAQVLVQVLRILLRRLPVHPRRAILAGAPVGLLQPGDVDVMRQGGKRHLRGLPGQRGYPLASR